MWIFNRPTGASQRDYNASGAYSLSIQSGTIAAALAAASPVFAMRWSSTTHMALVTDVRVSMIGSAGFASGHHHLTLDKVTGMTTDPTGGLDKTPTGNTGKLRTAMVASKMASVRVSDTALLTVAGDAYEATPVGGAHAGALASANVTQLAPVSVVRRTDTDDTTVHPLVLDTDEGLVLRATVPATGTWTLIVDVEWMEVPLAYGT